MTSADRAGVVAPTERVVSASNLEKIATRLLVAAGSPVDLATIVARSLVESNLVGHDSHGVMRVPRYVAAAAAGNVEPTARATYAARRGSAGHVDGRWGWGQPAAALAVEKTIELARSHSIGVVTIGRCNHVGRLGEHVEAMASAGFLGIALCNAEPVVAPYGGRARLLGTNPIALACPRQGGPPVVFDIATSGVAEGKLSVAQARRQKVPLGLIVDKDGSPSADPQAFYDGGALLPFGEHKGYGLSVFIEILGGILSGSGAASAAKYIRGNGTTVIAVDPGAFMAAELFAAEVDDFGREVTSQPLRDMPAPMMPGDLESRTRAYRVQHGVDVPDETWRELLAAAKTLNVESGDWFDDTPAFASDSNAALEGKRP